MPAFVSGNIYFSINAWFEYYELKRGSCEYLQERVV